MTIYSYCFIVKSEHIFRIFAFFRLTFCNLITFFFSSSIFGLISRELRGPLSVFHAACISCLKSWTLSYDSYQRLTIRTLFTGEGIFQIEFGKQFCNVKIKKSGAKNTVAINYYCQMCPKRTSNFLSFCQFKGVCDSDLIKALEALKMLQIDTGW